MEQSWVYKFHYGPHIFVVSHDHHHLSIAFMITKIIIIIKNASLISRVGDANVRSTPEKRKYEKLTLKTVEEK